MRTDRIFFSFFFHLVLFLSTGELCAQTYTPTRVEGRVSVYKKGMWASYTSPREIGVLGAEDSLCVSTGSYLVISDQEKKDNVISDFWKGLFRGTVKEGVQLFKETRQRKSRNVFPLSEDREDEIGESAVSFRGRPQSNTRIQSVLLTLRKGGRTLDSKSISVIRKKKKSSYYYCVNNKSTSTLHVTLVEVNRSGSIVEVDRDLLHLVIPPQTELILDQYPLPNKRAKNGYYVIALPFLFEEAERLIGCSIHDIPMDPVKRDFNIVIAGRR